MTTTHTVAFDLGPTPPNEDAPPLPFDENDAAELAGRVRAAVTASRSLPLSERARAWDAAAAARRVRDWAGADDAPNARYGTAFFWRDGNGDNFGDYHLPFADVIDGTLTAIWNGVTAAAAAVQGSRGASLPYADQVKPAIAAYYSKAARQYDDDTISPPWEGAADTNAAADATDGQEGGDGTTTHATTAAATDDATPRDPVAIDPGNPGGFRAVLFTEEQLTPDGRIANQNATEWRDPPLCLMLQTETQDGHDGAILAASIDSIDRMGRSIVGIGHFDTSDCGLEAARLVANRMIRGVSVDAAGDYEIEPQVSDDGEIVGAVARFTLLVILGATMTPFQAIGSAQIEYVAPGADATDGIDEFVSRAMQAGAPSEIVTAACDDCDDEAIVASVVQRFDRAMFADPQLAERSPLRVTDDGRVYGHVTPWNECHLGIQGCVTAPRSSSGYRWFLRGTVYCTDGGIQPIGTISLGAGHADPYAPTNEALRHYDDTSTAVAWVNVGEDAHGIWVSGVLVPGTSPAIVAKFCAAQPSPDWRPTVGGYELVHILAVNSGGYAVAHVRDGVQRSLVASAYEPVVVDEPSPSDTLESRIAALERDVAAMGTFVRMATPVVRAHLAARFDR